MTDNDRYLKEMQEKIARKREVTFILKELYARQTALIQKVNELERLKEEKRKTEKSGLKSFFRGSSGKKEETPIAEKKYNEAFQELEYVNAHIEKKEIEFADLQDYEAEFDTRLMEKLNQIMLSKNAITEQIVQMEDEIEVLYGRQDIILDTLKNGYDIMRSADIINMALMKEEENKFQAQSEELKMQMGFFAEGLKAADIETDIPINFNLLQTDTINQTEEYVKNTMQKLAERQNLNEKEINSLKDRLEKLIIES